MNRQKAETTAQQHNPIFRALADERRREIVRILEHRATSVDIEELAFLLVAAEQDKSLLAVTEEELEAVRASLRHVQLPVLQAAGLVAWDDASETVTMTDHPTLADPKVTTIIETDAPNWDEILASLADERRRILLAALYRTDGPMERAELATEITEKIRDTAETAITVRGVLQQIHHIHLPKLADAGLVTYDVDGKAVTYEGHPAIDEEWLVAGPTDTPRAILSDAHQSADIWTLEGRDNVTERGRALCESADDELFMMLTMDGTVETACLRRIQDALDRGVDVYLGTQNRQLRDLVREEAPAVTIWEPQLDWLNLPPEREKVGRLIMADREEIMVGTIGEEGPNGVPRETAITGIGEDNPVVLLLREMLGSRLDHLDAQSEDFRSETPL